MPVKPDFVPRILIIDDEPFNLELLEVILSQYGYRIISAINGRAGRSLAESEKPDLILLDIMMDGENGFECAAALRLSPATCDIPIIFLTALDDPKNTAKGFDAGAVDFIVKPFEYRDVLQRIKIHLLLSMGEKEMLSPGEEKTPQTCTAVPRPGTSSISTPSGAEGTSFIHESVILRDSSEAHLLINLPDPVSSPELQKKVGDLLSANTGPIYSPSATMRNIGIRLKQTVGCWSGLSGTYAEIDRENRSLTVVNSGALPVIFLHRDSEPLLIERQSGELGSLGLGLPPCSTYPMSIGDRIFMFSYGMLAAFDSPGEAINELKAACALSTGVDIETACQAVGEMLQRGEKKLQGVLLAVEA
ncbi:response regulator [Maridesulfovibrio sp.]|uniref:response regulator n=1 Tax=Maridesulfovibrio sp. TaxID=2795000 RepID=UPI002A18B876|nr:response regulator [Maridesulfovibrio sp.]